MTISVVVELAVLQIRLGTCPFQFASPRVVGWASGSSVMVFM